MKAQFHSFDPVYLSNGKLDKAKALSQCTYEFYPLDLKVFDNNMDKKLKSFASKVKSFCCYSNLSWQGRHRHSKCVLLNDIDLLIFDFDSGVTISDMLKFEYKSMILTTISHTAANNKFRLILPLSTPISFKNSEEYRCFMEIVNRIYFNNNADSNCFDTARCYISHPDSLSQINDYKNLFEAGALLALAKKKLQEKEEKKRLSEVEKLNQPHQQKQYTIEDVKRFAKVQEYVATFSKGNHYSPVYKIIGIGKKSGLSNHECAELIMSYNIGNEYSDKDSLIKKAMKYD
mgnify:CR=1 FL=1